MKLENNWGTLKGIFFASILVVSFKFYFKHSSIRTFLKRQIIL